VKIRWWYFPAGLGGAVVVACILFIFAFYLYAYANIVAMGFVLKGHKHYDNGEYEEAVKWYDRALSLRPFIARGHFHYDKGKALAKLGRYEEALELYDEALPYLKDSDIAFIVYEKRADALAHLGRWEEAVEDYGHSIDRTPTSRANDPSSAGDAEYDEENYAKAIAYFEAAAETDPDDSALKFKLGVSWLALGFCEKAVSYFDDATELAPDDGLAWNYKAWTLGLTGRYETALECADRALALDADDPNAWITKGKILILAGDAGGARRCFDRGSAQDPSSAEALSSMGLTYFVEAKYDEARPYYERLTGPGGSPYGLIFLYLIDRAEGRPGAARLQPLLDAPPYPWLGRLCRFLSGGISADDLLAAAEGDRMSTCEAHFFIGYINKLDGDDAAARRHFEEAVAVGRYEQAEYSLARYELARTRGAGE
jgi:superkiller protein 3